jgi:hypothetical protein
VGKPLVRFWEGQENNRGMEKILGHRRESRRKTEKTNIFLQLSEASAYSKILLYESVGRRFESCLAHHEIFLEGYP